MRTKPLFLMLLPLAVAACGPAEAPAATFPVMQRTGQAQDNFANEPPNEVVKGLAQGAVDVARVLPGALETAQALFRELRNKRAQHPPTYQVLAFGDWRFLGGWYSQGDGESAPSLRATVESEDSKPAVWDLTEDANYAADVHGSFPGNLVRARLEIDAKLPGGRAAIGLYGSLGEVGQAVVFSGTGVLSLPASAGSATFQALNAKLDGDGLLESGELVLRAIDVGATIQVSGKYRRNGLTQAIVLRSAMNHGELVQVGGAWQIKNGAGSFPL